MRSAAPVRRLVSVLAVLVAAAGFGVAAITIEAPGPPSPAPDASTSAVELRAGKVVPAVVRVKIESSVDHAADSSRRLLLRAVPLAAVLALLAGVGGGRRCRTALLKRVPHAASLRRVDGPTRAPPSLLSTPA